jgi:hypothetical protein
MGEGMHAHRCTHGPPPRPHLIVQCMFAYGIGILPLTRQLKAEFPQAEQPWYADNAGAGAKFDKIERFFRQLCNIGPLFGYYPEPTTSILNSISRKQARL